MDPDYLPFHSAPSKPTYVAPAGAVDAHCHVFGPAAKFPYAPERKYTPCDASKQQLFELRDHLGLSRNVIVQATCHGKNNDAMVDALRTAGDLTRGVAMVGPEITDDGLKELDEAGVRGVRFNFLKRLVDAPPREVFMEIAERVVKMGWHCVVYFESQDLEDLQSFLTNLPGTIVVDHMGRPDVTKPLEDANFNRFMDLISDHPNFWVKVSCPERLSLVGPPYDDVVPFARTLVDNFTDRVLWGTDWPHPNMKSHVPDEGHLVDIIPKIAISPESRQALLVDNPMRLYWG